MPGSEKKPDPAPIQRSSGLLLHPSSLPGPYGIGDLGPEAFRWIDTLAAMKQTWWQILPLGPTGFGDSPYQSYSAFAGNVNLLSPQLLIRDNLLSDSFFHGKSFPNDKVDFPSVNAAKKAMAREAWDRFRGGRAIHLKADFETFREREKSWLADYSLFMAIRDVFGGAALATWSTDVLHRKPAALAELEKSLTNEVMIHAFGQFLFDRQWAALKAHAVANKIKLLGDAPIFVAGDSSDVWANPHEFLLNEELQPLAVAGVPPDYFSEEGQHWGNPLYDWDAMERTGYRWWVARLKRQLSQVDLIRLDHFRGFAAAWHVPAAEKTAKNGKWVDGPRAKLFDRLKREFDPLPIIAEDLGLITPDVHALREQFELPGMRVIQFMLGGAENPYWPHNYEPNTAAYTGTHDNDTSVGWYGGLSAKDRKTLADYSGHPWLEPAWEAIRLCWASVAVLAIAPLQDLLGLGKEARMNTPGVAEGNWGWRFQPEQFGGGVLERLTAMTEIYGR